MSNKSTEANFHIVTPQGGVNQRDDVASLDEKTFSNLEGIRPTQTGLLERIPGKAVLAKYTDAIWGIAQCWTPAGLIAGYSQYGGSLTYQPWTLTWNPIDVTTPPWLPVDPVTNLTVQPTDNSSSNSSSGAAGGTGQNAKPHWVWQTKTLTLTNHIQYKGDTSVYPINLGTVTRPPGITPSLCPPYLAPLNNTGANSTYGFRADLSQDASVSLGAYHGTTPPTYSVVGDQITHENHNTFSMTIPEDNAQIQLKYSTYKENGDIISQTNSWVYIATGNYNTSSWLPAFQEQIVANSDTSYEKYIYSRVEPTDGSGSTYLALVMVYS